MLLFGVVGAIMGISGRVACERATRRAFRNLEVCRSLEIDIVLSCAHKQ